MSFLVKIQEEDHCVVVEEEERARSWTTSKRLLARILTIVLGNVATVTAVVTVVAAL